MCEGYPCCKRSAGEQIIKSRKIWVHPSGCIIEGGLLTQVQTHAYPLTWPAHRVTTIDRFPLDNTLYLRTFFPDKWQRPSEHVHKVGQPVGMFHCIELSDVHHIVLVLEDGSWEGGSCDTVISIGGRSCDTVISIDSGITSPCVHKGCI